MRKRLAPRTWHHVHLVAHLDGTTEVLFDDGTTDIAADPGAVKGQAVEYYRLASVLTDDAGELVRPEFGNVFTW